MTREDYYCIEAEAEKRFPDDSPHFAMRRKFFIEGACFESKRDKWISVKDSPLFTTDEKRNWICTKAGEKEFIAAIQLSDNSWWIRHCVVEDRIGLCVVGDDENEPAGYELEDVEYYQLIEPPIKKL